MSRVERSRLNPATSWPPLATTTIPFSTIASSALLKLVFKFRISQNGQRTGFWPTSQKGSDYPGKFPRNASWLFLFADAQSSIER